MAHICEKSRRLERCLLWMLAMACFLQITMFSSQTATESSEVSGRVLKKVIRIVSGVKEEDITVEMYGFFHNQLRKMAHFINFFILGFVYTMLVISYTDGDSTQIVIITFLCGLSAAGIDEGHQLFVPGRSAEVKDVCVDFSGVIAGCTALLFLKKVFRC